MLLRRQTPLATRSSRLASLARSTAAIALAALASLSWTAPRLGAQQEKTTRSAAPTETAPSAAPRQEPLRYSMKLHYGDEKDLGTIVTRLAGRGLTIEKLEIEPAEDGKRRTAVLDISMPSLDLLREVSGLVEPAVVSTLMPTTVKPAGRRGPASAARAPRVRFNFEKTDVRKVIDALAKISGSNIVVADEVQGEVTMRIFDLPWREALDIAARQVSGKVSERDGGVLVVEKAAAAK